MDPMGKVDLFILWSHFFIQIQYGVFSKNFRTLGHEKIKHFYGHNFSGWFLKGCFGLCVCVIFFNSKGEDACFSFSQISETKKE